ncbi:MAG: Ig-like domain-containing protein [Planctomycetes bacterium]|nr:Ig-like domain-containing protein [Planctomycetota bacterium]
MKSALLHSQDRFRHFWQLGLLLTLPALIQLTSCDPQLALKPLPGFVVKAVSPPDGSTGVTPVEVRIAFSALIDPASLGRQPVKVVEDASGAAAAGAAQVDPANPRLLKFRPACPFKTPRVTYRVTVAAALQDVDGKFIDLNGSPLPSLFTTGEVVDAAPSFGGITRLEAVSSSSLRASWEPARDPENLTPPEEIVYRLYLAISPAPLDYQDPYFETPPGAAEALLTGLSPSTTYVVGVRAVDAACNEDRNAAALSATTLAEADRTPPVFAGITELFAKPPSATALTVKWMPASDLPNDPSIIRYQIFMAKTPVAVDDLFKSPARVTGPGETSAVIDGLESDQEHAAGVRAIDASNNVDGNTTFRTARTLASYSQNVSLIFRSPSIGGCVRTGCHNAASRRGGLSLETYDDTLRGGVTQNPPTVVPGNAAGSYLICKLDRSCPEFRGLPMPQGRLPLAPEVIAVLRRWIDQGALNN